MFRLRRRVVYAKVWIFLLDVNLFSDLTFLNVSDRPGQYCLGYSLGGPLLRMNVQGHRNFCLKVAGLRPRRLRINASRNIQVSLQMFVRM